MAYSDHRFMRGKIALRNMHDHDCDEALVNLRKDTVPNTEGVTLTCEDLTTIKMERKEQKERTR